MRALDTGALRWPGGILSDWYDWEDAIGAEKDLRKPLDFAQWKATWMSNDVGIDEFLQLCEYLDIHPVINVNYATSTASHAAEFVEYVNGAVSTAKGALRASNGHSEPYAITWWEIGNETWGSWVPNPSTADVFASGYNAVSYTHLMPKCLLIPVSGMLSAIQSTIPVSYTHLEFFSTSFTSFRILKNFSHFVCIQLRSMIRICKPIDLLHNICQLRIAVARNTRMIYDWLCYVCLLYTSFVVQTAERCVDCILWYLTDVTVPTSVVV